MRTGVTVKRTRGVSPGETDWRQVGRGVLLVLGGLYLAGVWLEGAGTGIPGVVLPRTPLYFLQIAALFPRAATNVIDYRAQGWVCKERKWREIDTRAYFPLDPDDKENRFQRVMHFFRDNRPTMHALDQTIVSMHGSAELSRPDGISDDLALGGIRVLSLRLPLPDPGAPLERIQRKPLSEYPKSERKYFYYTPERKREERCGYKEPVTRDVPQKEPTQPAENDAGPKSEEAPE
jgi:hypothetical protein